VLVATATIELVYLDASGSTGAVTMHASAAQPVTEIAAQAEALAAIIAPICDCELVRSRIKYKVVQEDVPPAAIGSSVKRQGAFFFDTSDDTPIGIVSIPGISNDVIEVAGVRVGYGIDVSNSDVVAFLDELIAINATNSFGDAITSLRDAYVQSRT